jgi:hypothetical protein
MSTLVGAAVSTEVELETLSIQEYMEETGFDKLDVKGGIKRTQDNNYPYITILSSTRKQTEGEYAGKALATNIYFTKKCEEQGLLDEGIVKGFLGQFQAVWARTPSADVYTGTGNKRKLVKEGFTWKLCPKGGEGGFEDMSDYL